jgi:FkbM family methyltransferase
MDLKARIDTAVKCHDSASIPKVSNAGEIMNDAKSGRTYQIMHNGLKTFTDSHYGDFNVEIIKLLKGHHEPQEELIFHKILDSIPQGGTMLELGSFWAYYSMWFNTKIPNAKNYMVEPMQDVIRHGVENFELNGLKGEFVQACVGEKSSASVSFKHWDNSIHDIRQISVDDFLVDKGIKFLDILHADIQGAELGMLKGAAKSLSEGKIGYVFISTHSESLHFECMDFIKKHNYKIITEHTLSESYACDGLIVAAKDRNYPTIHVSKRWTFEGMKTRMRYFFKSILK